MTVSQACQLLDVSRSGYYVNAAAHPLVCAANVHLKAAFSASRQAYGRRRLTAAMAERGLAMGRHRVRTLMRLNGLRPVWRRKFVHTTDSKHTMAVSSNVLNRQFAQALPNQAWVCDITLYPMGVAIRYRRTRRGQPGYHLRPRAWNIDVAPRLTFAPYTDRTVAKAAHAATSLH